MSVSCTSSAIHPINQEIIRQSFDRQFFPVLAKIFCPRDAKDAVIHGIDRAVEQFDVNDCTTTQKVMAVAHEALQQYLPTGEEEKNSSQICALNALSVLERLMLNFKGEGPSVEFLKVFIGSLSDEVKIDVITRLNNPKHEGRGRHINDIIAIVNKKMRKSRKARHSAQRTHHEIVRILTKYASKKKNVGNRQDVGAAMRVLRQIYAINDNDVNDHYIPLTGEEVKQLHQECIDRFVKAVPDHIRPYVVRGINGDWSHKQGMSNYDVLKVLVFVFSTQQERSGTKQEIRLAAQKEFAKYMKDPANAGSRPAIESALRVLDEILLPGSSRQEVPLQEGSRYGSAVIYSPFGQVDSTMYEEILHDCQVQNMAPRGLSDQADIMRPYILSWLEQIGVVPVYQTGRSLLGFRLRPPENPDNGEKRIAGMNLSDHKAIDKDAIYSIGPFKMSGKEIQQMIDETDVTFVNGSPINKSNVCMQVGQVGSEDFSNSQFVLVSGPVHIPFDNMNDPIAREPNTTPMVNMYSIPGINLNYSRSDQEAFATEDEMRINDAGRERMKQIVGHVFEKMKQDGVKQPVMSAIGCGAFKLQVDGGKDAPRAWAQAMYDCLAKNDYGFEKVWISTPVFDDPTNNQTFIETFDRLMQEKPLNCPVAIANASMLSLASTISRYEPNSKVGILNPSDAQAVREGAMGMYWNHGHIALEELLALYTTALLQQVALKHRGAYDRARAIDLSEGL